PGTFAGRKLGVLMADGSDAAIFNALKAAVKQEKAMLAVIAPEIGGVTLSDGSVAAVQEKIDGGPSVLFDAVCLLLTPEGAEQLRAMPPARDFVADAFAHMKFIGYTRASTPLLKK